MRVTTVGLNDVDGYVICVILVAHVACWRCGASKALLGRGEFATLARGPATRFRGGALGRRGTAPGARGS